MTKQKPVPVLLKSKSLSGSPPCEPFSGTIVESGPPYLVPLSGGTSKKDAALAVRKRARAITKARWDKEFPSMLADLEELFKAPWDWLTLPIDAAEPQRAVADLSLVVEQRSGRKIWLESLHQYRTYAGLLAGSMLATDFHVEAAVTAASKVFGASTKAPALLRPRLIATPLRGSTLPPGTPAGRLPYITSIALFESDTPAGNDEDMLRSSAIIVWWQEQYGLPTDHHTLTQLRELDWSAHAWDWTL